jgi:hypothetical protein
MRKAALLAIAVVGLVSLMPVSSSVAAREGCAAVPQHAARLTIKALKIVDRPIRGYGMTGCALAYGPVWDPFHPARPGDGESMVIDAHDVTPVPGYDTHGKHGPFYHLNRIKPGYMAKIKWNGVWRRYRFVTYPYARRQCLSKRVNNKPERLDGELMCVANDKPIKHYKTEVVYFRCCWPRYTRRQFLYERAVLVQPTSKT